MPSWFKYFAPADEFVARFVRWVGLLGILATAMVFVARHVGPIAQFGWGAVVFAGLAAACTLMLTAAGCLAAWRYFRPLGNEALSVSATVPNCIDTVRTFMQFVPSEGGRPAKWIAHIYFARSGGPAHLRLDFSYFPGGMGHVEWTQPRKLLMKTVPVFVGGQDISVSMIECRSNGFWYWAADNGGIIMPCMHRCRLVLLTDDKEIGYFTFVITTCKPEHPTLVLLGENHFKFAGNSF
jgi:hypothetical protein